MQYAENTNDMAFKMNASVYPNEVTDAPPRKEPAVSVVHCVIWVSEFAVCNSSRVAMEGRMAARPLVKNGDANINSPLSKYSSHVRPAGMARIKARATTARTTSLRIMIRRRSMRSSSTPAMGPATITVTARASSTLATTNPEPVFAKARLKTAMLLKLSPTSLTTWPIHVAR